MLAMLNQGRLILFLINGRFNCEAAIYYQVAIILQIIILFSQFWHGRFLLIIKAKETTGLTRP